MATETAETKDDTGGKGRNVGRIEEIQGVVIEAVFPDELPEINSAITIDRDGQLRIAAKLAASQAAPWSIPKGFTT